MGHPSRSNSGAEPRPSRRTRWVLAGLVLLAGALLSVWMASGTADPPADAPSFRGGDEEPSAAGDPGDGSAAEPTPDEPEAPPGDASREGGTRPPLSGEDVAEIRALLDRFAARYNAGDHEGAAEAFTVRVRRRCGGRPALVGALRENHGIERMRYRFEDVEPWPDRPNADVVVVEDFGEDDTFRVTLGLRFAREGDSWLLDVLFPVGVRDFCAG